MAIPTLPGSSLSAQYEETKVLNVGTTTVVVPPAKAGLGSPSQAVTDWAPTRPGWIPVNIWNSLTPDGQNQAMKDSTWYDSLSDAQKDSYTVKLAPPPEVVPPPVVKDAVQGLASPGIIILVILGAAFFFWK